MHLTCKHCGEPIRAEDMSLETLVAKCRACNAVFGFAGEVEGASRDGVQASRPRERVPLPKRFAVEEWGGKLTIFRRWFTPAAFFLIFFCAFWDGFLIVWYTAAFVGRFNIVMVLFPLIHLTVGVVLTYFTLCLFLNRTRIDVEPDLLTVRHGPLPWPGNRSISSADLEQLYTKEKITRGKHGPSYSYEIHTVEKGGGTRKLLSGLDEIEQALFVEQAIEDYLRIQDRPVPGEYPR